MFLYLSWVLLLLAAGSGLLEKVSYFLKKLSVHYLSWWTVNGSLKIQICRSSIHAEESDYQCTGKIELKAYAPASTFCEFFSVAEQN